MENLSSNFPPEHDSNSQQSPQTIYALLKCDHWKSIEQKQEAVERVESLSVHFSQAFESRKAQAEIYLYWTKDLIEHGDYENARKYLQKAIKACPIQEIWQELEKCYERMESILGITMPDIEKLQRELLELLRGNKTVSNKMET